MLDGFYALYYTGKVSSGFALVAITKGIMSGVDSGGGIFDGEYTVNEDQQLVQGTLRLTIPAGVPLVTGTPPSTAPYTVQIPLSLPIDFSQGQPILVRTPIGPVNLNMTKLRDILV